MGSKASISLRLAYKVAMGYVKVHKALGTSIATGETKRFNMSLRYA